MAAAALVMVMVVVAASGGIARKSFNAEGFCNAFNMHSRFHVTCRFKQASACQLPTRKINYCIRIKYCFLFHHLFTCFIFSRAFRIKNPRNHQTCPQFQTQGVELLEPAFAAPGPSFPWVIEPRISMTSQNPKSKRAVWSSDFGSWILEFEFCYFGSA